MPTRAERKQIDGAVAVFHSHYARLWGNERWHDSLYPSLAEPTRYALLVNQFACRSELDSLLQDSNISTADLHEVQLPELENNHGGGSLLLLESPSRIATGDSAQEAKDGSHQNSAALFLFPAPAPAHSGGTPASPLLTHWNLDAASALCAYMLDVGPGDRVLDLCAAPGGKSVALAQLIFPYLHARSRSDLPQSGSFAGYLHCNEIDQARNKRLAANIRSYMPSQLFKEGRVKILRFDGSDPKALQQLPLGPGGYDRVLLDAPCSSERHIIHAYEKAAAGGRIAEEMAHWRPTASKNLAKLQTALLLTAIKAVRVGGKVVYSTCSIEPGENDGVVEKVLELLEKQRRKLGLKWNVKVETGKKISRAAVDLMLDRTTEVTEYGRIALPDHKGGVRWGPLYFCVLIKLAI